MSAKHKPHGGNRSLSHLLDALLADGLTYRAYPDALFCWSATCPLCRKGSLRLWIQGDNTLDDWEYIEKGTIKVRCMRGDSGADIERYLYRPLKDIRYERRIRELQSALDWCADSFRRYIENH